MGRDVGSRTSGRTRVASPTATASPTASGRRRHRTRSGPGFMGGPGRGALVARRGGPGRAAGACHEGSGVGEGGGRRRARGAKGRGVWGAGEGEPQAPVAAPARPRTRAPDPFFPNLGTPGTHRFATLNPGPLPLFRGFPPGFRGWGGSFQGGGAPWRRRSWARTLGTDGSTAPTPPPLPRQRIK